MLRLPTININDNVVCGNSISMNRNVPINIIGNQSLHLMLFLPVQASASFNVVGAGAVLNINADNITIKGAITNGANGTLNVNAGVTTATDSTITTIQETNIADNTAFNINSVNNDVDLLDNGTNIVLKGANSKLDLVNTSNTDDRTYTLYANLNPSNAEDEYGVVRVGATTNALTVANNGGPYTIGQDNTHRLKEFEVKGAGNIVIYNTVFTKRFNMNSTGQVTLNQALALGAGGNIAFGADGTLISDGGITGDVDFAGNEGVLQLADGKTITGNVDSSSASAGTLEFLGKGTVIGSIGATNTLTKLKFSGAGDIAVPQAKAKTIEVANAGANVTASDALTGDILFSKAGTLAAQKGIIGNNYW